MRRIASITFVFVALSVVAGCKEVDQKKDVIAQVGRETLTLRDLSEEIPHEIQSRLKDSEIKEYVLRWINKEVLYQEALGLHLEEQSDFKREIEGLKKELLINKLLEVTVDVKRVEIADEEIQTFYDQNNEAFLLNDDVVHCYHVLCRAWEEADGVRNQLSQGVPFDEVVSGLNADSLEFGNWDLGYFTREQIIPEISKVVFNLPVGYLSSPIKSEYGYHVLKVVDKRTKGQKKALSEVKEEIRMKLAELRRQEYYERFLLQTKNKYQIQSNFQLLGSMTTDSLAKKGE